MGTLLGALKSPLTAVIDSIGAAIDNLHTSDQEKLEAKLALAKAEMDFQQAVMAVDAEWARTQADVIKSEVQSGNWLASSWRPILMLTFTFIIAWNFILAPIFSQETVPIPDSMWELLKLGMGGYIIGRTGEKMMEQWKSK